MKVEFKDIYGYKAKFNFSPLFMMEKITPVLEKRLDIKQAYYMLEQDTLKLALYKDVNSKNIYTEDEYLEVIELLKKLENFDINKVIVKMTAWGERRISIHLERG